MLINKPSELNGITQLCRSAQDVPINWIKTSYPAYLKQRSTARSKSPRWWCYKTVLKQSCVLHWCWTLKFGFVFLGLVTFTCALWGLQSPAHTNKRGCLICDSQVIAQIRVANAGFECPVTIYALNVRIYLNQIIGGDWIRALRSFLALHETPAHRVCWEKLAEVHLSHVGFWKVGDPLSHKTCIPLQTNKKNK